MITIPTNMTGTYEKLVGKMFDVYPGVELQGSRQGTTCTLPPGLYRIEKIVGAEYTLRRDGERFTASASSLFTYGTFFDCIKGI